VVEILQTFVAFVEYMNFNMSEVSSDLIFWHIQPKKKFGKGDNEVVFEICHLKKFFMNSKNEGLYHNKVEFPLREHFYFCTKIHAYDFTR
jgi:hypothetical protein